MPKEVHAFFVRCGAKGGAIGGKKRMASLTPEERSALGKKAVQARKWRKVKV